MLIGFIRPSSEILLHYNKQIAKPVAAQIFVEYNQRILLWNNVQSDLVLLFTEIELNEILPWVFIELPSPLTPLRSSSNFRSYSLIFTTLLVGYRASPKSYNEFEPLPVYSLFNIHLASFSDSVMPVVARITAMQDSSLDS